MIEFVDDETIWRQVYRLLRTRIEAGTYRERQAIPSIRQLVQELGVADGTVQKALTLLKRENYITPIHGKGNYVRPRELWTPEDE